MDNEVRIVSIIPYKIFPATLGGEKGIALFNEYLCDQVHLTGITVHSNDPSYAPGYRLLNILPDNKLRYVNPLLYFSVRKIIIKEKATHLLIEHPYYGWLAWLIRKTMPVRLVVHSHNIEYMRSKSIGRWWWKILKWYEGWVYRIADRVLFISEDDMQFAIRELNISPTSALVATYGIEQSGIPIDIEESKQKIRALHQIHENEKILLFNGALYHSTNYEALNIILKEINPLLLNRRDFKYKIIICGRGLPTFFNELKEYTGLHIIYAGFVEDISIYFKAADIFLNPILAGGGVKTKAIEALAVNCTVISTQLGAMGINQNVCGNKLHIVQEGEWVKFVDLVVNSTKTASEIPEDFFKYYYWKNILKNVIKHISTNAQSQ